MISMIRQILLMKMMNLQSQHEVVEEVEIVEADEDELQQYRLLSLLEEDAQQQVLLPSLLEEVAEDLQPLSQLWHNPLQRLLSEVHQIHQRKRDHPRETK